MEKEMRARGRNPVRPEVREMPHCSNAGTSTFPHFGIGVVSVFRVSQRFGVPAMSCLGSSPLTPQPDNSPQAAWGNAGETTDVNELEAEQEGASK